jgi:DNA-binding NtrC family response regulator
MNRNRYLPLTQSDAVLLVTAEPCNLSCFMAWCRNSDISVSVLHSCRDAVRKFFREHFTLVFCDERLPDGSWKDVLGHIIVLPDAPRFVVLLPSFDPAVWADVINLGAYEALARPLDQGEMQHLAEQAGLGSVVPSFA